MYVRIKTGFAPEAVIARIKELPELTPHLIQGTNDVVIAVIGDLTAYPELEGDLLAMQQVADVGRISAPFKLTGRQVHPEDTLVRVGEKLIGNGRVVVIAGPCAVESREQVLTTAWAVKSAGATFLRGGAFKPRTSPYGFQGLKEVGLKILAQAKRETGLGIVTEVMSESTVDLVAQYADILQIGARNAQNFDLLTAVARSGKPVLLKRGMAGLVQEWLLAAEYILKEGNPNVILCERGIRTFESATRNTMDVNAIALVKELSHLPVIADPSHATGKSSLVRAVSLASLAAGADGLLLEVHPSPEHALSDGAQSLTLPAFRETMAAVKSLATALGRPVIN